MVFLNHFPESWVLEPILQDLPTLACLFRQASIAMFSWPGDTQSRWGVWHVFFLFGDFWQPKIWAKAPSRSKQAKKLIVNYYTSWSFSQFPPENGWLGDDCFPCGMANFQGRTVIVLGKLGKVYYLNTCFFWIVFFLVGGRGIAMLIHIQERRNNLIPDAQCMAYFPTFG